MRHLGRIALLLSTVAAWLPTGGPAAAAVAPAAVISSNFPDPDILQVGSTFYAYSTSGSAGRIPVASAPSATGPWTRRGDALPNKPSWAGTGGFWAPDVSRRPDGRYLMYFTGPSTAAGRMCLGAAVADDPLGPFQPLGSAPLVCNASEGGDIDPSSFVDADGKRYLLYKNDGNAVGKPSILWLQQVAADGVTFVGGRTELIRNDRPEEAGVIEAPVLVKRASQYVLFYSGGSYTGNSYFTGYAVSPSLKGPYTKAYRPLMTTATFDGAVQGPGGTDVLGNRAFFHGWVNNARWMYTAELGWANDYPVIRGSRVRYEAERGAINHAEVRNASGASQGAVVAKLDYADSWVDVTVYAPVAGAYTAHVTYAAGYGDAQHRLTVNGGAQIVVDYPDRGWENWTQVPAGITLNAGWNVLRFQHQTRWAELDHIEIA
ncbi:Carbohydrate binding module (family 35) [Nonomuraea solani]|uniref:Carbohydrate binding module (Family 35) n=1 Tax=Nonomuraea solani TaxID=1144553 RepID=A0A1H6ETK2_9ACTN|nr:family 43 glycosylhydrolase [Nonomuraea solani]SEH01197.1 Carbohydrate binding module (family 35) [Nonomuraea solani]